MTRENKNNDFAFVNEKTIYDELAEATSEDIKEELDDWDSISSDAFLNMDGFDFYIRSIAQIPLLTEEEERNFAIILKTGRDAKEELDKLEEMLLDPDMSEETRSFLNTKKIQLEKDSLAGKEAANELVSHNLRLVISVAKHFSTINMTLEDLVQEGSFGLMRATETYDYTKGFRFTTYATWWIRQTISRGIAMKDRVIRLPVHIVDETFKIRRTSREMSYELGREPEISEIALKMGISEDRVKDAMYNLTEPTSLFTVVGENQDTTVGDFVADENAVIPENAAIDLMMQKSIKDAMDLCLSDREKDIVARRFGLFGCESESLEAIGIEYGITRERVRQLENIAIKKLRGRKRLENLKEYLYA